MRYAERNDMLAESDTVEVVELLSALTVTSDHGYQAAVECLWCWQVTG